MYTISQKIDFLSGLLQISPEMWDVIHPHGYKLHAALREYALSTVIRDVSTLVRDAKLSKTICDIGKEMVSYASANLLQGWEAGDDICPPTRQFPIHWHMPIPPAPDFQPLHRSDFTMINPQPFPPKYISSVLKVISELTTIKSLSAEMHEVAGKIEI